MRGKLAGSEGFEQPCKNCCSEACRRMQLSSCAFFRFKLGAENPILQQGHLNRLDYSQMQNSREFSTMYPAEITCFRGNEMNGTIA